MSILTPISALAGREILRFSRQKSRVIGGLAQPILIWVFLGAGFSGTFQSPTPAVSYAEYAFPGILLLLLLFSSVFSAMSLIEDRDHGFLQGVLASALPRSSIVFGKVLGGSTLALMQSLILLLTAPLFGMPFTAEALIWTIPALMICAIGFAGTGFVVAWSMGSTSGFHAVMMVILMPAWMLSGALFPASGVPHWLSWVMDINPLSAAHSLITATLWLGHTPAAQLPTLGQYIGLFLWISVVLIAAIFRVRHVRRGRSSESSRAK